MGKLYTLDEKLLVGTPEVRIGAKVYPVDDRQKTVKKMMAQMDKSEVDSNAIDEALEMALGKAAAKEIDEMNVPFAAYQRLFELVLAAMTGEDPDDVAARFQEPGKAAE